MAQIWAFWVKKYQLFNLSKILNIPYLERADFRFGTGFQKTLSPNPQI